MVCRKEFWRGPVYHRNGRQGLGAGLYLYEKGGVVVGKGWMVLVREGGGERRGRTEGKWWDNGRAGR